MNLNQLRILFWNARGITNKLTEFKKFIYQNDIDVACVCESFLKSEKALFVKGYRTMQKNRTNGRFGGLFIIVKENLSFGELPIPKLNLL